MDEISSYKPLSSLANVVIATVKKKQEQNHDRKLRVNPVISKVATWYEKLRNAMEYREDEVILRAAIERILKRRLLLGGNAKTTAQPLVRELIWAGYLPDNSVGESLVDQVEETIDLYLSLRLEVLQKRTKIPENIINEWFYHLMSSQIQLILAPNVEKETVASFMFHILQDHVSLIDESDETKNAQVFIAVRRAFAKDDVAFLRYHLFTQYFGQLTKKNLSDIAEHFLKGYNEIVKQLHYPRKDRIFNYIKRRTAAFFILEDLLHEYKDDLVTILATEQSLQTAVFALCERRYQATGAKVRRAIIRSVLFLLLTKAIIAIAVEGTYERIMYQNISWFSIGVNTGIPPLLMVVVSLFLKTPGQSNSKRIFEYIEQLLFDEKPQLGGKLIVKKVPDTPNPILNTIFVSLWLLAFVLSFGSMIYVLFLLHFNIVSQAVFLFFLAIVSFFAYRISLLAHLYMIGEKQSMVTPLVDFLFMPVVRVGQRLTQGVSQLNVLIFIFDLFIETPFKVLFGFFEQWFHFLHAKREEIE